MATILGGRGDDVLNGTGESDRIAGRDGNDTLAGRGRADLLAGGAGADALRGGDGTGIEVDLFFDYARIGGDGGEFDVLARVEGATGTPFADSLFGDDGANVFRGLGGADFVGGAEGDDTLAGDGGADLLAGGEGADRVAGGEGADRLGGGAGNDVLVGGPGRNLFDFAAYATGDGRLDADGRDTVVDFEPGRDAVTFANDLYRGDDLFAALDSDGSGRLDAADRFVSVGRVRLDDGQVTTAAAVLDLGGLVAAAGGVPYAAGSATLTLLGVTDLAEEDVLGNPS